MSGAQHDIFEGGLEGRFQAFDKANPHVYPIIYETAVRLAESGRTRFSIAEIVEEIRYERTVATRRDGKDDFKINNSYRAFYARKLLRHRPDLFAGKLQTRQQRSA